jgi:pyruvate dehydrogenase E2 component (dihydrolipoamide acetyltransferase)
MSRQVFTLPDLGEGLTEAELVTWLVGVGDTIAVDAPVAEVETAKASVEVPSPFAGVVAVLHGEPGEMIAVGAPLLSVDPAGTSTALAAEPASTAYAEEERAGSGNVLIGYGTTGGAARGGRRRRRGPVAPAGPPVRPAERPRVTSPLVRKLARERGLDLTTLVGTGPGGLVTRADVQRATPVSAPAAPEVDARTGLPIRTRVPLRGVRRAVTATLTRSRQEIPEATTWVDVDATALLDLRAAMARDGRPPGLLALIARFVVAGLSRFPELNARVDVEREEIEHLDGVHLGIATQTERGLVVATVRDAHRRSIRDLSSEIRRLAEAARNAQASAAELTGSSFTLNNYGVLGVDGSAAIINHPEVAILGLGRVHPRPWVVDGEVVPRQITQLSLVFDHRVCDGGTAGGFLRFVADAIENPLTALADL